MSKLLNKSLLRPPMLFEKWASLHTNRSKVRMGRGVAQKVSLSLQENVCCLADGTVPGVNNDKMGLNWAGMLNSKKLPSGKYNLRGRS